MVKISWS